MVRENPVVFQYSIAAISCGFSVVVIEHPTESLPPHDRAVACLIVARLEKRSAKTLMRALNVVVGDVLAEELS